MAGAAQVLLPRPLLLTATGRAAGPEHPYLITSNPFGAPCRSGLKAPALQTPNCTRNPRHKSRAVATSLPRASTSDFAPVP